MTSRRTFIKSTFWGMFGSLFSNQGAAFKVLSLDADIHLQISDFANKLAAEKKLTVMLPKGSESNIRPVAELFTELTGTQFEFIVVPVDSVTTEMFLSASTGKNQFDIAWCLFHNLD